ncbi:MAG: DUF2784 domain-containing protein [Adhaeribacter sp.]
MPLVLQDYLYTALHLAIIGFNLLGWIWPATRKGHFICVLLTAGSWLLLGLWYGIGYCPITDWQWQVKEKLGEQHLPASFIKYYADKLSGRDIPASLVDLVTAGSFALAAGLSVYVNFFRGKSR